MFIDTGEAFTLVYFLRCKKCTVANFLPGADTSGTMDIADIDGDGYKEIISAGYSAGKVYFHTFAP